SFDFFEPYSTISAVVIGTPTFVLATFVYATLLRIPQFRDSAYFRVFIAHGFIDLLAFLSNLLRNRLPLFPFFNRFFYSIRESDWATTMCTFAVSMPRAQLVAQLLISCNRLL
ncbi:hypothetical protein PFISCL1PPCAC_14545, partial [Pristionchus fissidentatus]